MRSVTNVNNHISTFFKGGSNAMKNHSNLAVCVWCLSVLLIGALALPAFGAKKPKGKRYTKYLNAGGKKPVKIGKVTWEPLPEFKKNSSSPV